MDTALSFFSNLAGLSHFSHRAALSSFSNLQIVLANRTGPIALSQAFGATTEAIQLVDHQIAILQSIHIWGNFEGGGQMAAAVAGMQVASRQWPPTRAAVVGAAQATVTEGPAAAALGASTEPLAQMVAELTAFSSEILVGLRDRFVFAGNTFAAFDAAMDRAYGTAVNANSQATAAITRYTQEVQFQIDMLRQRQSDLRSAGSVILGIFTLGATIIAQIRAIDQEINQLNQTERMLMMQQQGYQAALGGFRNAQQATQIAALALETVNTSLEQATNSLKDIIGLDSSNPVVMRAELSTFKTEFAGAVAQASRLLG
jgi:hypothetical protein